MVGSVFVSHAIVVTLMTHTPVIAVRTSTVYALLLANILAVRTVDTHPPHLEVGLDATDLQVP